MNHRIKRVVLGAKAMPFEPPSAERDRERLRRFEAGRLRAQVRTSMAARARLGWPK